MRDLPITGFLDQLAARVPAPGGGATAALHAAQAAALLGMVARYSDGPKYTEHAATIDRIRDEADAIREQAVALIEADVEAFGEVAAAYRLPKQTDQQRADRSAALAAATARAAEPPAAVLTAAGRLVELAEQLLPVGNPNVVTDVAAAAEAARAAATTARLNLEVNRASVQDGEVEAVIARADRVTAAVRATIAG
ncbi:MAG TPA: cyclodeaminase/cyclohydrolase family protein [Natronosporangium sp.]